MTEAEWLEGADSNQLLLHVRRMESERKLRLYACACCRRIWHLLDEWGQRAIETAENFADGTATEESMLAAQAAARPYVHPPYTTSAAVAAFNALQFHPNAANSAASYAARAVGEVARRPLSLSPSKSAGKKARAGERAVQSALLRCIFGNPFQPANVQPAWASWNGGTVPKLAQAIYEERAFDRLPILADALEEAGCTDAAVLAHCRGPGEHVRGCWVIDLLLGKS